MARAADSRFDYRTLKVKLSDRYPRRKVAGRIHAALDHLLAHLDSIDWVDDEEVSFSFDRILVDSGYETDTVLGFCRQFQRRYPVMASKGVGITAKNAPMSEWARRKGEKHGRDWVIRRSPTKTGVVATFDANAWKTRYSESLVTPIGNEGALSLYSHPAVAHHQQVAEQNTSEYSVETSGRGRVLNEWQRKPNRDNHLFDAGVLCFVAASIAGVRSETENMSRRQVRRPKKVLPADLSPGQTPSTRGGSKPSNP